MNLDNKTWARMFRAVATVLDEEPIKASPAIAARTKKDIKKMIMGQAPIPSEPEESEEELMKSAYRKLVDVVGLYRRFNRKHVTDAFARKLGYDKVDELLDYLVYNGVVKCEGEGTEKQWVCIFDTN